MYIVKCANGTYYTGYTSDLDKRIKLHNSGKGAKYTRGRGPLNLVWKKEYKYYKRAVNEEIRIKTLSKKEKEKLIYEI